MINRLRVACLLPLLLIAGSCGAEKPDVYSISIPTLKIDPESSITSMDVNINAGTVEAMENIPFGWNISISNDASWRCRIKGSSTIGATSLGADELRRVAFIVRRNESQHFKFDVNGSFTTSNNSQSLKTVEVVMKDFKLDASRK